MFINPPALSSRCLNRYNRRIHVVIGVRIRLIPIYREKEIYTMFYDSKQNKLYRYAHREKSSFLYILLFIIIINSSGLLNQIYQPYKGFLLNIILLIISNFVCYFVAKYLYSRYYIQTTGKGIFLDQESMKEYARKGEEQYYLELNLGGGICLFVVVIGFALFCIFNQIQFLIIGSLGSIPLFMIFLNRPFRRLQVLRAFQNKEIEL